jgi:hypothetical protein
MSVNPENTVRIQDGRFRAGVSGNPTRENSVVRLGIDGLEKLAGRRCAAWVKSQKDRDKIGLVETRNYIPLKTAFYATWLVFEEQAASAKFLEAFPYLRLDERISKITDEREELASDLDRRPEAGMSGHPQRRQGPLLTSRTRFC